MPDGAAETSEPPKVLAQPVLGIPGAPSVVDRSHYWTVAMPFGQTLAWMKEHPPRELTHEGSGSGGYANAPEWSGDTYSAPASAGWPTAQLEVAVAPDGKDRSAIRADGIVVWLDQTPMKDTAAGKRLRVGVGGPCPPSDLGDVGVSNAGTDLDSRLLPAGKPGRGLVCVYTGGNGDAGLRLAPFALKQQRQLDSAGAKGVADAVDAVSLSHVEDAVISCPADDGAAAVVVLAYPGRGDVDLWLTLNGCIHVANGHIGAAGGDLPDVVASGWVPVGGSAPSP